MKKPLDVLVLVRRIERMQAAGRVAAAQLACDAVGSRVQAIESQQDELQADRDRLDAGFASGGPASSLALMAAYDEALRVSLRESGQAGSQARLEHSQEQQRVGTRQKELALACAKARIATSLKTRRHRARQRLLERRADEAGY